MSIRNLEFFFKPSSVVVIGASDSPHNIGGLVLKNLLRAPFQGAVIAVNPKHAEVAGVRTVPDVSALANAPELAVICTPAATVPGIIASLGAMGTKAAVVISAGFKQASTLDGTSLTQAILDAAKPHLLRIIGPNCLGILIPAIGLNASFAPAQVKPGKIAFISQSGALATAIIDWGNARKLGFSCFFSVGDSADVDLGDLLDYLGRDEQTEAILLYIESINGVRKFMSAARTAARAKPVIAVKAGRVPAGARAAASHTGALAGDDDIIDAMLRRAGILRVDTTQALFDAAETLARIKPYRGKRLAIVTNGGGAGVMATDALINSGGTMAELSPDTVTALNKCLPSTWSHANPADIIGDAPTSRYVDALSLILNDPGCDAALLLHAPTAVVPSAEIATAVIPVIESSPKNTLTCFMGEQSVVVAREQFAAHNIPSYLTPEDAVRAFLHMNAFHDLQTLLLETAPLESGTTVDRAAARKVLDTVLAQQRNMLTESEAKAVLDAYGIPCVQTENVRNTAQAVDCASRLGFPVVLKIRSPDLSHKSEVGGVALNLADVEEVSHAADSMMRRITAQFPNARIDGFTVQPMIELRTAQELIIGIMTDPIAGPVIMVGHGGIAVEIIKDRVFGLPPLDQPLARDMLKRTRVAALLAAFRNRPALDRASVIDVMLKLSQLICETPEIVELDINPLLVMSDGALALDARIKINATDKSAESRLAIRPYPLDLERKINVNGLQLTLRPIRPDDEPAHTRFLQSLAPEDIYFRFFHAIKEWSHTQVAQLTQIDYDREMAFVLLTENSEQREILGVARCISTPDNDEAEFGIIVRHDQQHQGLGYRLMHTLIDYSRARGTGKLVGYILSENFAMLKLAEDCGFARTGIAQSGVAKVILNLAGPLTR